METIRISKGGQISLPAAIRRRWGVERLLVVDEGKSVRLIPVPDDPIGAVIGAFAGPGRTAAEATRQLREEEAAIADRKGRGRS